MKIKTVATYACNLINGIRNIIFAISIICILVTALIIISLIVIIMGLLIQTVEAGVATRKLSHKVNKIFS